MTIHISKDLETRIREKVRGGDYRSEDDVIEAALTLLDARDVLDDRELARLRAELDKGLDDIEQGRFVSLAEVVAGSDDILDRHEG